MEECRLYPSPSPIEPFYHLIHFLYQFIHGRSPGHQLCVSLLEDTYRIQEAIEETEPDVIIAVGGGSTIDATKSSSLLAKLTPGAHDLEPFFGVGKVTEALAGGAVTPLVAVQTAASSAAHLTKYSNITDLETGQK